MKSSTRLLMPWAFCAAALVPVFAVAHPNDPTTTQPASVDWFGQPRRPLSVEDLSLEMGLDLYGSNRKVRTDAQPLSLFGYKERNKDFRADETLGLRSSGSVVRDDVLRYDLYLRGGLTQEQYSEDRPWRHLDNQPNGQLLEYDLRLQAFQAGKISGTAFASQLESRIPRPFLPSLDQIRSRYGSTLVYNDAKLPMSLNWESSDNKINSGHAFEYNDSEEDQEDRLNYEATWQPTENHSLHLNYEYQNTRDRYSGTRTRFDTLRNLLSLDDTIQFGETNRHRLETLLRVDDEKGDLAQNTFEFSPNLRLQHTDNFFTNYRAQYLREDYYRLQSETWRGDVGMTHLFKDLLTSTMNVYGMQQNQEKNADVDEWGAIANFSLNKEHSGGRFSSNLSYLHSATQTNGGRREGVVVGEAVTFRDPLPAILAHTDVSILSITVIGLDRRQMYIPGRDFVVIWVGRYAALQRIPTGMILDRQTVLVSYTYRVFNDFELNRDRVDLRVQDDLKMGLTPYYAMSLQDEDVAHDRYLTWQERDVHRHRLGITYRQTGWSVGPEYEYNNDSIDPYQALHLNGDVVFFHDARQQLSGHGSGSRFFFDGQDWYIRDHNTTLIDLGLNYSYLIAERLEAGADAMYRYETDSTFGRTQGVDLRGTISYRIGLFTVLFELEYDSLHLPQSEDDSVAFWVKVRRVIPVIGEARR